MGIILSSRAVCPIILLFAQYSVKHGKKFGNIGTFRRFLGFKVTRIEKNFLHLGILQQPLNLGILFCIFIGQ